MAISTISSAARWDGLRTMNFGDISGSFQPVGGPFSNRITLIKFINTTDGDLIVSFDGVVTNDLVPAGGFSVYDLFSDSLVTSIGTQVYVASNASLTKGAFYIVAVFARGQ